MLLPFEETPDYTENPNYYESRMDFPRMINDHGWKVGVEVGCFEGEYSAHLLEHSNLEKLYSIDKWRDHLGDSQFYPPLESQMASRKILRKYGRRSILWKKESIEASWEFQENQILDFVYLDAGADAIAMLYDLGIWWKKVKVGGFFGGSNYLILPNEGASVIFLVDLFAGLVGQKVHVTGAKDHSPQERHQVACRASAEIPTEGDFERPSWWIIKE